VETFKALGFFDALAAKLADVVWNLRKRRARRRAL
jgi:hypothetical protein